MFLSKRFREKGNVSHIAWSFSCEILVLGTSHLPMTTPKSTISEPYKHLRIAKAFMVWWIAVWRKHSFWVWSVSDVSPRIGVRAALPC
jgi:hypothetical protein